VVVSVIKGAVGGVGGRRGMRSEDGIGMVLPKGLVNRWVDKTMRDKTMRDGALQLWHFYSNSVTTLQGLEC
jgi:hypothetical protein